MLRVVASLKANNWNVGGIITQEIRSGGSRVGFEIRDLSTGKRGWLAHVDQKHGPQIGRYRVNMNDLDSIGAEAIIYAVLNSDVVIVDEVGPMEVLSDKFKEAVRKAVGSQKPLLAVVHWKASDKLIASIREREDVESYLATQENREHLDAQIVKKILDLLS
jgi:nucleoside-triphosphatase